MFDWPDPLVAEIAERRCIAFIGAGFSHQAKSNSKVSPPLWSVFLDHLMAKMHTATQKQFAVDLIKTERYLDAAEVIKRDMIAAEYNAFLQQELRDPNFQPSKSHEYLRELDLSVVITTNYDTIYEDCCRNGQSANLYNTIRYSDDGLLDDLRSTRRIIVKAHGCVSQQAKTVLTRSDYFTARQKYPSFFTILDAIFTTRTLLFIGYGLGDPDIQLVLENVALKTSTVCPHYLVTEAGRHPAIKESMSRSYNLHLLEHDAGAFHQVEESLKKLYELVVAYRQLHP
jgi:hypothetical protein